MINKRLGIDLKITGNAGWFSTTQGDLAVNDFADIGIVDDVAVVDQALKQRLNTQKGELWAHPEYGNPVFDILSELMSNDWYMQAVAGLKECINDEPRAECVNISYDSTPQERRVEFTIRYKIVGDGRQGNLIWDYAPEAVEASV